MEVNVEAHPRLSFLLEYANGVTGVVQLNFYQKIPKRTTYDLVFDEAVVQLDYFQNKIVIQTETGTETIANEGFERDALFRQQTIDFLKNTQSEARNALTQQYLAESEVIIKMCC